MKHFLINISAWEIVEHDYVEPANWSAILAANRATMREAQKKNNLALFYLQESLDEIIFPRIANCASTKATWKALKESYEGNT